MQVISIVSIPFSLLLLRTLPLLFDFNIVYTYDRQMYLEIKYKFLLRSGNFK